MALTVDEFLRKYYCADYNPGRAEMKADLEEMLKDARSEGVDAALHATGVKKLQ